MTGKVTIEAACGHQFAIDGNAVGKPGVCPICGCIDSDLGSYGVHAPATAKGPDADAYRRANALPRPMFSASVAVGMLALALSVFAALWGFGLLSWNSR